MVFSKHGLQQTWCSSSMVFSVEVGEARSVASEAMNVSVNRVVDAVLEGTVVGSFTKIGSAVRSRVDGWDDLPRLDGRTIAISGVTSGLGRAAAERLAGLGAALHVVGRSEARTATAAAEIAATSGNDDIAVGIADLSSVVAAAEWAAALAASIPRLDAIIHNAGALDNTYGEGPEGIEQTAATHILSPFVITETLLPVLAASDTVGPGRVIVVTSGGMYTQRIGRRIAMSEDRYDGLQAYARAKRSQVALVEEWAQRIPATTTVFHAMHPGWADTPGVSASIPGFGKVLGPLLRTADDGADTMCWLAAAAEPLDTSGRLWLDRRPRSTRRVPNIDHDADDRRRVWEWCSTTASEILGRPIGT